MKPAREAQSSSTSSLENFQLPFMAATIVCASLWERLMNLSVRISSQRFFQSLCVSGLSGSGATNGGVVNLPTAMQIFWPECCIQKSSIRFAPDSVYFHFTTNVLVVQRACLMLFWTTSAGIKRMAGNESSARAANSAPNSKSKRMEKIFTGVAALASIDDKISGYTDLAFLQTHTKGGQTAGLNGLV